MEGTMDITEFFRKLKFVCHWIDTFKDLKWSNVPGVKLSSLSESDDTFPSLQALLNLHYLFGGFMDYLWFYLDNLFGPLYEEYYSTSPPEASNNFAAHTLDNENTSSSWSNVVEEDEAPQIVSSSTEQVASEPNTPVLNENANEFVLEDVAEFDGNVFDYPP
ncbi:hypothetical protein Tco_0112187 [Tanacetum coccineum]